MTNKVVAGKTSYERGLVAEGVAAQYLLGKGYELLEARYKTSYGEIDIIARDGEYIVAVEVKTRKTLDQALESVTMRARSRIQNSLLHYISSHEGCEGAALRFDVVAVIPPMTIQHLDNAWQAYA